VSGGVADAGWCPPEGGRPAAPDDAGAASVPGRLLRDLRQRVAARQHESRVPALTAALRRRGEVVLQQSAGEPAGPDVQFRIGSITKTFTAALVLQLRDEGRLGLDDPLERHLAGTPCPAVRIRELLGHLAGLAREPRGPFWEASPGGPAEELLAGLRVEDVLLPGRRRWHYSNVAYALLGMLVARLRGASFPDVLSARLLQPLGLRRTSWEPCPPHADGWWVHPHADVLRPEPVEVTGAMGPAGQLWSTATDLTDWGCFLADPDPAVLRPDTVEEMCDPVALTDQREWTAGYGLGVQLYRRGQRVLVGHGGSMPGFVAGLAVSRPDGVAGAACANAWQGAEMVALSCDLVTEVLDHDPAASVWLPGEVPPEHEELLGRWHYRGVPIDVLSRAGALTLQWVSDPTGARAERFRAEPGRTDTYRGLDIGQAGELLRVCRDDAGGPVVLDVGGWLLTRAVDDPRGGP
jgi:CubicO group peptidase (beta-lactamase class C family)